MKTNQVLTVTLCDSVFTVETKTKLINLSELFIVGNLTRVNERRPLAQINNFIMAQSTKDYVSAVAQLHQVNPEDLLFKKQGRNKKEVTHMCHLSVAIFAAEQLSPQFHASVINEFITNRLIEWRIDGGDEFNNLRSAISTHLPEHSAQGLIIQCANRIRARLSYVGEWNDADAETNRRRATLENFLVKAISAGLCRDKYAIYMAIETCPF